MSPQLRHLGGTIFFSLLIVFKALPLQAETVTNELKLPNDNRIVEFSLAPSVEFDGKSKAEILGMREARVKEHAELLAQPYVPSPVVFGQVVDGKPWWGFEGIFYYGDGPKSIEGLSEESRFVLNPFLLIAIREAYASRTQERTNVPFEMVGPVPEGLTWKFGSPPSAYVEYHISELQFFSNSPLGVITYNARDLGFSTLYLDPKNSYGIEMEETNQPFPINQFIHVGQSCKYPGGCNNGSPFAKESRLKMKGGHAIASFKLWRKPPRDGNEKEDFRFTISMM